MPVLFSGSRLYVSVVCPPYHAILGHAMMQRSLTPLETTTTIMNIAFHPFSSHSLCFDILNVCSHSQWSLQANVFHLLLPVFSGGVPKIFLWCFWWAFTVNASFFCGFSGYPPRDSQQSCVVKNAKKKKRIFRTSANRTSIRRMQKNERQVGGTHWERGHDVCYESVPKLLFTSARMRTKSFLHKLLIPN